MFHAAQYALLEFGGGRKRERFGGCVIDRPLALPATSRPAGAHRTSARGAQRESADRRSDAIPWAAFDRESFAWTCSGGFPAAWTVRHAAFLLELRLTDSGQVGVFPEQAENWDWLAEQAASARRPLKLLNLFAYTGGSTLAAAAAGAHVTHVDAARSAVDWARRNAELSGLREAPIRWIAEDALKFLGRELRRGNRYDGWILDPPSYGHGPRGEAFQIRRDLAKLLSACAALATDSPQLGLLTCHTPGFEHAALLGMLRSAVRDAAHRTWEAGPLSIVAASGAELQLGSYARFSMQS